MALSFDLSDFNLNENRLFFNLFFLVNKNDKIAGKTSCDITPYCSFLVSPEI